MFEQYYQRQCASQGGITFDQFKAFDEVRAMYRLCDFELSRSTFIH
jgi:hypothetical protein